MPPRQLKVLGECVEFVNSIRTADGCGIKNIENIYAASPPRTQAVSASNPNPVPKRETAEADAPQSTAYPYQRQAATGVGVPDFVEGHQEYIEGSDGSVPNVNVVNQLTKKDIADGAFDGTRRALARFINPRDETPIEKVHRLRCDDVEWKYIARTIYKEENGKNIDESDLDSEVKRLQKQHKREYPEFYQK